MAEGIKVRGTTGLTLYAIVWRPADLYVWDADDEAFEAPGIWDAARIGACDIPLTEVAGTGWYQGDFPVILTGVYFVEIFERAGGAPALADDVAGGYELAWSGTREIDAVDQASNNRQYMT